MPDSGLRPLIEYFEQRLARHGDDPRAVDWNGVESQYLRFEVLTQAAELRSGDSLLDVGCGLGHLVDYLEHLGLEVDYTGLDLSGRMIEAARERRPDLRFVRHDLLSGEGDPLPARRYDVVLNSGMFHLKTESVSDAEFEAFVEGMVRRMWELTGRATVFNLMTEFVDWREPKLYYAPLGRWIPFFRSLTRWFVIRHDYPLYEFVVRLGRAPFASAFPRGGARGLQPAPGSAGDGAGAGKGAA